MIPNEEVVDLRITDGGGIHGQGKKDEKEEDGC